MNTTKPTVYIASAYTKGDVAVNVRFQCRIFDFLLTTGKVLPYAPLMSHFQHALYPRPYADWIAYDLAMLPLFDACLRLDATDDRLPGYCQSESSGADGEVAEFTRMGKPVFYDTPSLLAWADAKLAPDLDDLIRCGR